MKKNKKGIIYSTNSNFNYEYEEENITIIDKNKQLLKLHLDKHRAGKTVVIIKGFIGEASELKRLAKAIKKDCGVGGSVKNNEIIIQGNVREKIIKLLNKEGYKCKKSGG